jgi:hypothetical protein
MRIQNGRIEARIWELVTWVGVGIFLVLQLHGTLEMHRTPHAALEASSFESPAVATTITTTTTTSKTDDMDWFDMQRWTSNPMTNSCFVVENICHSTHRWFYDSEASTASSTTTSKSRHQPFPLTLLLKWSPDPEYVPIETLPAGYPERIRVGPKIPANFTSCHYSPIPNHLSLHSSSNHMLGEFYIRVLMGLWDIFVATGVEWKAFAQQSQLYMHFQMGRKGQLLHSHSLLLDLLTSNPILPFQKLLDNTNCRCLKRLILCGYEQIQGDDVVPITLKPSRRVGIHRHGESNSAYGNSSQHIMRQVLLEKIVKDNLILQRRIHAHREAVVRSAVAVPTSNQQQAMTNASNSTTLLRQLPVPNININDWKIVGLAQRAGRRRWEGLEDLEMQCNQIFLRQKIACVTVNIELEEWSNPVQHVVAHGGLDALVGIHGAQLTEALLMPPGSLVVELLPWIHPTVKWGRWTTWVHRPTPLGVLFSETNLNHIGYPLGRSSSVDDCADEGFSKDCYMTEVHQWDNRDFRIEANVLWETIDKFVARTPRECWDWEQRAGDDYVLYNVRCIPQPTRSKSTTQPTMTTQHYYRDIKWGERKTTAAF